MNRTQSTETHADRIDNVETQHRCDWCLQERACEQAKAGTGHLWICDACFERLTAER